MSGLLGGAKTALMGVTRTLLSHLVTLNRQVISLWPPLGEGDSAAFDEYRNDFVHYFGNTSVCLCSYWRQKTGEITVRVDSGAKFGTNRLPTAEIWSVVRYSSAVLLWRADRLLHAIRPFPNVYPMFISLRRYGYWLQIVAALTPKHEIAGGRFQAKLCDPLHSRSVGRIAVICSGPSSRLILDEVTRDRFDEMILVNRALYAKEYYDSVERVWLCAYDRLLFSPADKVSPPFLEALPEFLGSPSRHFVTMSYGESFLRAVGPEYVLKQTLFLSPRDPSKGWNIDLCEDLSVQETSNVTLTLALPLAATLAEEIVIFGMDGASTTAPKQWDHNEDFRYDPKQGPGDQREEAWLLRERRAFYRNTGALVTYLTDNDYRLFIAAPSHNEGLKSLPIWPTASSVQRTNG